MKLQYKPEVDTLRAISVLAVIIYHSKIYFFGEFFFQGGYYGVDIFFVISGYLITSLIYQDLKTNTFSIKQFYLKRCRRIFPALIFTILISLVLSWYSIMPISLVEYAKSIIYSITFISNYFFYFTGLEYGAVNGLLKPLLHTWSLGIEEQFYIIFPLIFIFGFRFFKKHLIFYFGFFILISFLIGLYFSKTNPNFNFYFIGSRVWELLIGSLLFLFSTKLNFQFKTLHSNFATFIGIIIIFISFQLNYDIVPNPNLKTLLPILGASIIILTFKRKGYLNLLFVNKFALWIGLISYSLYLIHYPIFAFVRANRLAHTSLDYLIVAVIIFLLSFLSYRYIEKPFRNLKIVKDKLFLTLLTLTLLITLFLSTIIIHNKGFENRFPKLSNFSTDYQKYRKELNILKYELGVPIFKDNNKKNILVVGNSHGRDLFNVLKLNENLFPKFEFSILDTDINCLIFFNENSLCNKIILTKIQKQIINQSDIILFSSKYNEKDLAEFDKVIKIFQKKQKKVIIASNKPEFYFSSNLLSIVDEFFLQNNRLPNKSEKLILQNKYFTSINPEVQRKNTLIKNIAENNKVLFFETKELICLKEEKTCEFLTDKNEKIIFDDSHFTVEGAKYLGNKIKELKWFEN